MFPYKSNDKKSVKLERLKLWDNFTYSLTYRCVHLSGAEWDKITGSRNLFLSMKYLEVLENSYPLNVIPMYLMVYRDEIPVMVGYFQVTDFTADVFADLLVQQVSEIKSKRIRMFERYLSKNKDYIVMRLVTCGNNLISGNYGFAHDPQLSREIVFSILSKVAKKIGSDKRLSNVISAVLIKDFSKNDLVGGEALVAEGFTNISVEPDMVIHIPEKVETLEQYISLFSKKYRNRAKAVLKASETLVRKEFGVAELEFYRDDIFELYEQVYARARYKIIKLSPDYFINMKTDFSDRFFVTGFFKRRELVSFDSYFSVSPDLLEAHYIGIDYALNKEHELYQNILYHLVELAATCNKKSLNLGRTASEIKSTVGAQPVDLHCFIAPQNTITKIIMKTFVGLLQPGAWIPRNPFAERNEVNNPRSNSPQKED